MRWGELTACMLLIWGASLAAAEDLKSAPAKGLPEGLAEKVAAQLDPQGVQILGADGPVCTVWLAKALPVKPMFKPSLTVKYPFTPGQLVGVLQVHSEKYSDFREQPVKAGVYTLRYGHQPTDGNHVGTSELSDFFLAVPAGSDTDPAVVKVQTLMKRSAKATGSNHPAIYSLLPATDDAEQEGLVHEAGKELWILHLTGAGKDGDREIKVTVRLVVVGKSEG